MNKWILTSIILLVLLRIPTLNQLTLSDESIYLIMSQQVMKGFPIYSSFFFAHPPLLLLLAPLAHSIILVRLALIFIQAIIILLAYKITKNEFTGLILVLNPLFALLNVYLGFGLMLVWLLLAYYFKDKWYCVIFASLALLTRLFAIFPLLALSLSFKRLHKIKYTERIVKVRRHRRDSIKLTLTFCVLIIMPIALMFLIVPNAFAQLVLYHTNKIPMLINDKLITLATALISLSPLIIPLKFKRYNKELLAMSMIMLAGILIQKSFFITYFSPVMLLLACSMLKGLGKEETKLVLLLSAPLIMFSLINNYQLYVNPADLILKDVCDWNCTYSTIDRTNCNVCLPITGESGTMHAYALANNLELISTPNEPGGVIDTSNYRFSNEMGYFNSFMQNESDYYLIINACGTTRCWISYINTGNYDLVRIDTFNNNQKVIIMKKKA